jgi:ribosome-associated protein
VIRVNDILPITDYFVLITCANVRHVKALSAELRKTLKNKDEALPRVEGSGLGWWHLLDLGAVVVHLFEEKARAYYDMDNLLADAEVMEWQNEKIGDGSDKE